MVIKFFCPRWGSEELDWDRFCRKVRDQGFDGVEAGVPFDEAEKNQMKDALALYNLDLIGQYWQSFEKDFSLHKASYQKHLNHLATLNPVKIDSQTGKDYFDFEQNKELFSIAFAFSNQTGISVAHETHRNKSLFAAHITKNYLEKIPSLRITADFSHWCNVAESLLEDQEEALELAINRSIHIHARVGHSQSAQVTDPRLPEWKAALDQHTNWWSRILAYHQKAGTPLMTITPEFGPAPYMPAAPITLEPLANQWEINKWMMDYLKNKFRSFIS